MKTIISICLLVTSLLMLPSAVSAQKSNKGCMQIVDLYVGLDAPVEGFDFAMGAIELTYAVSGDAIKSYEIIINGHTSSWKAMGTSTLILDLLLDKGESMSVTINTYSSSEAGKGKLCNSETRFIAAK